MASDVGEAELEAASAALKPLMKIWMETRPVQPKGKRKLDTPQGNARFIAETALAAALAARSASSPQDGGEALRSSAEVEVPPYDADALWAQASTVAGYAIKSEHPTSLVQVVNGDLVKLDALAHGPFACDERHEILYRETPAELRARAKCAEDHKDEVMALAHLAHDRADSAVARAVAAESEAERLRAELAESRAERCKMADTILRWQADSNDKVEAAEERATAAERERDEARAEAVALHRAFHDAVIRPCGVVPESGQRFYVPAEAINAEARRPQYGSAVDRQERAYQEARAAAALDPPPQGAAGHSGTREGRGEAADGGEGGGGAAHG